MLIIAFIYIILYEVKPIRSVVGNVLRFSQEYLLFGFQITPYINNIYMIFRGLAIFYIVVFFLFLLGFKLYKLYMMIFRKKKDSPRNFNLNPFEESFYKYLEKPPNGKSYLVTGEWGTGKTHIVNEFFTKYNKFYSKQIYRISCFGIDSRKLILDEIKNQIEINDKTILNWIQYIPGIGKPLYGLLKDTFSLRSIPKGSIFIFDDFERITSLGIINEKITTYEKSRHLLSSRNSNTSNSKEFEEINNEFSKVADAISKIQNDNELIRFSENLQKYNIVTGLINELVDNYQINVVIICNVDVLGHDYIDKVFRGKLDCITYNKFVDQKSLKSIFTSTLENKIYAKRELSPLVEHVLNKIVIDFETVWSKNNNNNLRQVKSVVQAFLDTIDTLSSKVSLTEDYLLSLFYSIYVVSVLRDNNDLEKLNQIRIGGNLTFSLHLYQKKVFKSLLSSKYMKDIKWTGIDIAGHWLLNLGKPRNIELLIKSYNEYKYSDLELTLVLNRKYEWQGEKLLIEHLIYLIRYDFHNLRENNLEKIEKIIKDNIENILEVNVHGEKEMIELVRNTLTKVDNLITTSNYYPTFVILFNSILSYTKIKIISDDRRISTINQYNKFIVNLMDNGPETDYEVDFN